MMMFDAPIAIAISLSWLKEEKGSPDASLGYPPDDRAGRGYDWFSLFPLRNDTGAARATTGGGAGLSRKGCY